MNALKTLLAGAALVLSMGSANAATFYADKVIGTPDRGDGCTASAAQCAADDRLTVSNALGSPDSSFYSLGFNGTLVVGFAQALFNPVNNVSVFEVTFNRTIGHDEAVDVYSVLDNGDGTFTDTLLGRMLNSTAQSTLLATNPFNYIKLVDATWDAFPGSKTFTGFNSFDGFDVNSVGVAAVPLPAAGLMLLAGLGGLGVMRRRQKKAC